MCQKKGPCGWPEQWTVTELSSRAYSHLVPLLLGLPSISRPRGCPARELHLSPSQQLGGVMSLIRSLE